MRTSSRWPACRLAVIALVVTAAAPCSVPAEAQESPRVLRQSVDVGDNQNGDAALRSVETDEGAIQTLEPGQARRATDSFDNAPYRMDDANDPTGPPVFSSPLADNASTTRPAGASQAAMPTTRPAAGNAPTNATGSVLPTASRSNTSQRARNTLPQSQVGELDAQGLINPRSNPKVAPIEGGARPAETDPYAAIGLRLGTLDVFPTLQQSVGYTTNADYSQNGSGAGFTETNAGLTVQSNWTRHAAQAQLSATYQNFFSSDADNLATAGANASLRLDLDSEHQFTLRGGYDFSTESLTSTNLTSGGTATVVERPGIHVVSASAELAKTAGRLGFSIRGSLDQAYHEDASLSDGTTLIQTDRDSMLAQVTGRLSYQASPAISPFIEVSVGQRIYDLGIDSNGNRRDSNVYALRGGLALDMGEKLTGQLAAGYAVEEFDDPNIDALEAFTIDGSLNWSPMRLTSITAAASTSLSPSANINDNGSVIYNGSLGISRRMRPSLTLDANLTVALQNYDTSNRRDFTVGANAGYVYSLNRFAAATGRISYQTTDSSAAGSSYDVGSIRFGLRLQR